jgi:hypothetical protein
MKGYWIVGMSLIAATMATQVRAAGTAQPVKDPDGKTLAVAITCDTCKSDSAAKGKPCTAGVEEGWVNGQPCGKCMLQANARQPFDFPYDIHLVGKLVDGAGNPVKARFVRMFTPVGWSMRSPTADDGTFHFLMGATAARKSRSPVLTDLGTHVDRTKGTRFYAFFLMPGSYRPCSVTPAAAPPKQPAKKQP